MAERIDLEATRARAETAKQEVFELCDGRRKWTMCVPAQPSDSDTVLMESLTDNVALCDELERTRVELNTERERFTDERGCIGCSQLTALFVRIAAAEERATKEYESRVASDRRGDRLEALAKSAEGQAEGLRTERDKAVGLARALRVVTQEASIWLKSISSGDGSGHADLGRRIDEMVAQADRAAISDTPPVAPQEEQG